MKAGANVNKIDRGNHTSLMWAAHSGNHNCFDVLLEAEAVVSKQDKEGYTALMRAAGSGSNKCIRLLLWAGAKINLVNNKEYSALTNCSNIVPSEIQKEKIIKLFYTAGETIDETKVRIPECSVKHLCRETIQKNLLDISRNELMNCIMKCYDAFTLSTCHTCTCDS